MMSIDCTMFFSLRCLINKYHFYLVFSAILIITFGCAAFIDVFEGEIVIQGNRVDYDLHDYMWCVFVIITTVGYGDITAQTNLGRLGMTFTALVGIIIVSIMIMALQQKIQLNIHEVKAFNFVSRLKSKDMISQLSDEFISRSMMYIISKRRYVRAHHKVAVAQENNSNLLPIISTLKKSLSLKLRSQMTLKRNISTYYNTFEPYSRSEDIKNRIKCLNSKFATIRISNDKTENYLNKLTNFINLMENTEYPNSFLTQTPNEKAPSIDISPLMKQNHYEVKGKENNHDDRESKLSYIPFVSNRTEA